MAEVAVVDEYVRTIIWDLDGTILNSTKSGDRCLKQAFEYVGLPEPSEEILQGHRHSTLEGSIAGVLGDMGQPVDDVRLGVIISKFIDLETAYMREAGVDRCLYGDAKRLVEKAYEAGKRQMLVTNRSGQEGFSSISPYRIVKYPPLDKAIHKTDIACAGDSEHRKPSPRVLDACVSSLSELGKIVVIGDQYVDAEFARRLGGKAILVQRTEDNIPYLDELPEGWRERNLAVVQSLAHVAIASNVQGLHLPVQPSAGESAAGLGGLSPSAPPYVA